MDSGTFDVALLASVEMKASTSDTHLGGRILRNRMRQGNQGCKAHIWFERVCINKLITETKGERDPTTF